MRAIGSVLAVILVAGCAQSAPAADSTYKSQYLDVHVDEGRDRVVVDDVRMTREWNYLQVKSSKATIQVAVNVQATRAVHHATLSSANQFVILSEPDTPIRKGDHLSLCGMSGGVGATLTGVSVVIGDSGSGEDLVVVPFDRVAACA